MRAFWSLASEETDVMNLLDQFVLAKTEVLGVHAELKRHAPQDQVIHAKVELKLSPQERHAQEVPGEQQIAIEAQVSGFCGSEAMDDRVDIFFIEVKRLANYRQFQGQTIDFATFSENHASLARQLYPIVQAQIIDLLRDLGLGHVNLPIDLPHAESSALSHAPHPAGHQVH